MRHKVSVFIKLVKSLFNLQYENISLLESDHDIVFYHVCN